MAEPWTDEEFLRYVEVHSRTERHLFATSHAKRLCELAGDTPDASLSVDGLIGIDADTADYYIEKARARRHARRMLLEGVNVHVDVTRVTIDHDHDAALDYARGCAAMADLLYEAAK